MLEDRVAKADILIHENRRIRCSESFRGVVIWLGTRLDGRCRVLGKECRIVLLIGFYVWNQIAFDFERAYERI